jgi:succinate-semialdehyde dehydrogenase / glutarate-semialdehyde dehydrogenase
MSTFPNLATMTSTTSPRLAPNVTASLLDSLSAQVTAPADRTSIAIESPFTEAEIGRVPESNEADAREAIRRARTAQVAWAQTPISGRVRILTRFHDLAIDRADTAMDIIQLEAGKARIPAMEEVFDTVATTRYYMNTGPKLLRTRRRAVSFPGLTTAYEYRHPRGVVGSITPWNFPLNLSIADIIPALLAGNAVVIKPDEKTPFSALYAASLLTEAGLPADVLQVVTGVGEQVGPILIDEADFVVFTGSTEVGRQVATRAGHGLIGTTMELGAKNAAIVMADADLSKTIPGISRAVFTGGGQVCVALERIYVDEKIRDEFTTRFVEHARSLPMTDSFDYSSAMSAMITREHLENVHAHVEDAVDCGAILLTGGKPRPDVGPLFYEPTVLTRVDETMRVCRNETFGPVVSIYGFENADDAVEAANDSDYGLNFSVWTRNTKRGVEVASRLQAGTVGVNDGYAAVWSSYDAPLGGVKSSGLGRRHGAEGLLGFTEAQTVAVQRIGPAFAPPSGMGYEQYQRLLGKALKVARRLPFYK